VVLDEVHLWSPKEKQRELLYFLSRDDHDYLTIMLSNNPRFLSEIDLSVRSTLQPELIHFRNYNAEEIRTILDDRANRGIKNQDQAVTAKIAGLTVKETNSDVRVGIKALFYWAVNGRRNVEQCFESAKRDIYVDLVADLSDTNLLILKAATMVNDKFAKKVFSAYNDIAKRNREKACSYVHFHNQLSYLQSLGLVLLLSTKVNRTYANRLNLICNSDIIRQVYEIRFQ
jgi:Cdc6-like AAA superfamily ATPase